jgi:hypothetical protein
LNLHFFLFAHLNSVLGCYYYYYYGGHQAKHFLVIGFFTSHSTSFFFLPDPPINFLCILIPRSRYVGNERMRDFTGVTCMRCMRALFHNVCECVCLLVLSTIYFCIKR